MDQGFWAGVRTGSRVRQPWGRRASIDRRIRGEGPAERRRARSADEDEVAASLGAAGSTRRVGEDARSGAAAAARATPDAGAGAGGGEGEEDAVDVGEERPPAAGEGAGPGRGGDGEAEEDVQEQVVGERAEVVVLLPAPAAAASGGGGALLAVEVHHALAGHPASAGLAIAMAMASRRLCEAASSALWLRGMQRKAREKTVRNRTAPWQPAMAQCDLAIQTLEIWRFFTKHPRLFLGHSFPSRNKTDGEGHLGDLLYPSVILQ